MARLADLEGKRFGMLTVVGFSHRHVQPSGARVVIWDALCDCGKLIKRRTNYIISTKYKIKSCGCAIAKLTGDRFRTHGHRNHPLYSTWRKMLSRCSNKKNRDYALYGGRGILVCEAWHDFSVFFNDMGMKPSPRHTLDRIDNNYHYCKENCRWALPTEQNKNKRNNRWFLVNGEWLCLTDLARKFNVNVATLHQRLARGLSVDSAINFRNE